MPNKKKLQKHVLSAINAAKDIFDNNKGDENTAYHVALTYRVSRNVLQKAFKDEFGLSIRDYKMKARMEISKKLLAAGKDAKEIFITVYYNDPDTFIHAFKRYYGVTPNEMFEFKKERQLQTA